MDCEGADGILNTPECQKLFAEFSHRNGRENRQWTHENIDARLRDIRERFGRHSSVGLAFGQFLYGHASEMLHGTLFSAVFVYGVAQPSGPPKSVRVLRAFRQEQIRLVLLLVGATLHALILIFSSTIGNDKLAKRAELLYHGV
ncbi:MAG: hypothetical protein PHF00_09065 [Elusimicrobia bacterium]|nr:hypothetical protein [Elusimicrobiota bacterium]